MAMVVITVRGAHGSRFEIRADGLVPKELVGGYMHTRTWLALSAFPLILACGKGGSDLASLERRCTENDMAACTTLGRMYFEGAEAVEDKDRAIELFDKACSGGDSGACANLNSLAGLYAQGAGVPRDSARAAMLYQKACAGGVAGACEAARP